MEKEQIQDLAIQFANEGLDRDAQVIYDAWALTSSASEKQVFTEMVDLCTEVAVSSADLTEVDLPKSIKAKIFNQLDASTETEDIKITRKENQEWINLPMKGAKWLELSANKQDGFVMSMMEIEAGCEIPEHDHHGVEMAYILEGDLETDGKLLKAGDFFRADAGSHHGVNYSPSGCRAIIVVANQNYHHKTMKALGTVQKALRKVKGVFAKS